MGPTGTPRAWSRTADLTDEVPTSRARMFMGPHLSTGCRSREAASGRPFASCRLYSLQPFHSCRGRRHALLCSSLGGARMLILTRRMGESLVIGDDVVLTVVEI